MRDYFNRDTQVLKHKKLFLFDMDGTIYRENDLYEGVVELLQKIRNEGGRYAFITNNPSKSVKDYIIKLNGLGIDGVKEENFFTSAQAAIMILRERFNDALIYAQGTKSLLEELQSNGLNVTTKFDEKIKVVLVSFDPELTGEKLRTTCEVLTKLDVPYYATNPDWVCPVDFGSIPDCGSMCVGIAYATGKNPIFIGKPEPTMVLEIMKKYHYNKDEVLVIGDRLYTDIASGNNAGVDTLCVLSGEATISDVQKAKGKEIPTYVLNGVWELLEILKA